jgi:hypothetical protein
MLDCRPRPRRWAWIFLMAAAAFLACHGAHAATVTDYITVQPIDVCSGAAGTTTGCAPINSLGQNYATAAAGNIGALDVTATGDINVTRAIWNKIGIDVTYMPTVQDPNAGSFLTVPVASCLANGTDCQSPQFQTLSDQAAISIGQTPTPAPPLSQNPTTVNTFFVNSISPPAGTGTLYGLAWINNNGVAIAANSLLGLGARADTLAHEIGHDLALDHTTFGAGSANDLMTAGSTRTSPTSGANAISQLNAGTADQLDSAQQGQVLLSGFMNPIPQVTTIVDPPFTPPSKATPLSYKINFVGGGRPGEQLLQWINTLPAGFTFDIANGFMATGQIGDFSYTEDILGSHGIGSCGKSNDLCELAIDFTGFTEGDFLDFTIGVCNSNTKPPDCGLTLADLAGTTISYGFSDGYVTTTDLDTATGISDSQNPDLTIPSQTVNPDTFAGASLTPCTGTTCPALQLADAFPPDEDPVPEPSSLLIMLSGLIVLFVVGRHLRAA